MGKDADSSNPDGRCPSDGRDTTTKQHAAQRRKSEGKLCQRQRDAMVTPEKEMRMATDVIAGGWASGAYGILAAIAAAIDRSEFHYPILRPSVCAPYSYQQFDEAQPPPAA